MKKISKIAAVVCALAAMSPAALAGCSAMSADQQDNSGSYPGGQLQAVDDGRLSPEENGVQSNGVPSDNGSTQSGSTQNGSSQNEKADEAFLHSPPAVCYARVDVDGVNIRASAGTGGAVRGLGLKSEVFPVFAQENGWIKTAFRGKTAYISAGCCEHMHMCGSEDALIEAVINEGCKLLGTPYVYGAVRYHDGSGRLVGGFTAEEFDCSSLMQYIFYKGAGKLLQVNTRTQIKQGKTVDRSGLRRGDLMFFTNDSRKNLSGVERVGHVALWLGDGYILHTASDYAKIELVSQKRWSYFIQAQRVL